MPTGIRRDRYRWESVFSPRYGVWVLLGEGAPQGKGDTEV